MQSSTIHYQRAVPRNKLPIQRGFSLVEIALAIALIAGAIVASLLAVNRIRLDQQLNSARNDAMATMNAAITAYASYAKTTGATPAVLTTQKIWPEERVTDPGLGTATIRGHFPGSREYMWENKAIWPDVAAATGFMYHVTNIPASQCAQLLSSMAAHPNVFRAYAGTYKGDPTDGAVPTGGATSLTAVKTSTAAPVNVSSLATACQGKAKKHLAVAFFKN